MSQLEPLLDAMIKTGAEEMRLEQGQRVYVIKDGQRSEVGRDLLSPTALMKLAAQNLGDDAVQTLSAAPQTVERSQGDHDFLMGFLKLNGAITIMIRRKDGAPSGSAAPAATASGRRETGVSKPTEADPEMLELLRFMVEQDASDIHLSSGSCPILRVHGEIIFVTERGQFHSEQIQRLVFSIMTHDDLERFQEKRDADLSYEIPGVSRFRVNVFEDRKGVGTVIRTIPMEILTAEQLNLPQSVLDLCYLTKGLVLVTGPTGSGKSTTLAAMVDHVNKNRGDHIITIEDPIEFVHENQKCLVNQRQVGRHTMSFKAALRAGLREDPDVVLVGELRDLETIAIAIETAETGHLVFGTLHTTTAVSTVDRVIDQFPPDQQAQIRVMLAEALKGVIAQVLCKRKEGGRVAALEVLLGSAPVASLIRDAKTFQLPSTMQTSKRMGMITMNDSLIALVKSGEVDPKEAWMKAVDKSGFVGLLKSAGISVDFSN